MDDEQVPDVPENPDLEASRRREVFDEDQRQAAIDAISIRNAGRIGSTQEQEQTQ